MPLQYILDCQLYPASSYKIMNQFIYMRRIKINQTTHILSHIYLVCFETLANFEIVGDFLEKASSFK